MIKISKPWGEERIIAHTDHYVVKEIRVRKGCRLSLQYHREKTETLVLVSGDGYIERNYIEGSIDHFYSNNISVERYQPVYMEPVHVPPGMIHRIGCYNTDAVFIEISSTELDDVVRLEDDYGRD